MLSPPLTAATIVLSLIDGDYAERTYFNAVDQGLIRNETSFAVVGATAKAADHLAKTMSWLPTPG